MSPGKKLESVEIDNEAGSRSDVQGSKPNVMSSNLNERQGERLPPVPPCLRLHCFTLVV